MPFTPAHPAAVLPLLRRSRRWLSASGLIVGSMAPDLEYFLRMRPGGGYGHTILGVFWLDLPLSLLVIGLFHGVVKRPLIRNLPAVFRLRLGQLARQPWPLRNLWSPRLLLGILVGCASHLVWDTFTHQRGRFAEELRPLSHPVAHIPLLDWLEYGSSLVGLLAVGWYVWQLPLAGRVPEQPSPARRSFWVVNASLTLVFWLVSLYGANSLYLGNMVVMSMSAAMMALLISCLLPPFTAT